MESTDTKVITHVYNFSNGMTMVFDQYGEQMPEYQGRTKEAMSKIVATGFPLDQVQEGVWKTPR